jgi:hypothetical protein
LARPVSSLTPPIEHAGFNDRFARLDQELAGKGFLHLKIERYFGDEWFCPDQSTAIAIPFWLSDDRLMSIERAFVGFVEGETEEEFMRLLRHEAGHCVDHAYRLSRCSDWQDVFGNPNQNYNPDAVKTVENHADFVTNLPGGYAQTHPEEDFAETFAVWLDPDSRCWDIYRDKPVALNKLLFVDSLMADCAAKKPRKVFNEKICQARRMRRTLESYYRQRFDAL